MSAALALNLPLGQRRRRARGASAALLLGAAALLAPWLAVADEGGKLYAKVGPWEVRKHPGYCTAKIGYDGDRALRISSGPETSSFGFMGPGTGEARPGTASALSYWFDTDRKNTFKATARTRSNQQEDGGAPWWVVSEKTAEFSPTGFMLGKSVSLRYRAMGAQQEETFRFTHGEAMFAKLVACSGV